jgi:hypothetical protein
LALARWAPGAERLEREQRLPHLEGAALAPGRRRVKGELAVVEKTDILLTDAAAHRADPQAFAPDQARARQKQAFVRSLGGHALVEHIQADESLTQRHAVIEHQRRHPA